MRVKRFAVLVALVAMAAQPAAQPAAAASSRYLPGTTCRAFPANNYWHADVSTLPLHPRSAQWLSNMSPTRKLHPDFGPSYGAQSVPYGIPITLVAGTHAKVSVR